MGVRGRVGACERKRNATRMQRARAGAQAMRASVWVQDPNNAFFYFFLFFSGALGK